MDPSQTRNQTGPPNIAGGLEGEGNDLRSRHTSLEIETHHRRTDRRGGGERAPPFRFSPLCPHLKRNSNTDYAAPQPPTHPSSVCGTPPCRGRPEAASRHSPLWFTPGSSVPSSFLSLRPSHPYVLYHLLGPSLSSLGLPCPRASGEAASPPSKGPRQALCAQDADSHRRPTLLEVRGRALPSHPRGRCVRGVARPWGPLGWVWLGLLGIIVVLFRLEVLGFGLRRTSSPGSAPSVQGVPAGTVGPTGTRGPAGRGGWRRSELLGGLGWHWGLPGPRPGPGLTVLGVALEGETQLAVVRGHEAGGGPAQPPTPAPGALQSLQPQLLLLEPAKAAPAEGRVLLHQPRHPLPARQGRRGGPGGGRTVAGGFLLCCLGPLGRRPCGLTSLFTLIVVILGRGEDKRRT